MHGPSRGFEFEIWGLPGGLRDTRGGGRPSTFPTFSGRANVLQLFTLNPKSSKPKKPQTLNLQNPKRESNSISGNKRKSVRADKAACSCDRLGQVVPPIQVPPCHDWGLGFRV